MIAIKAHYDGKYLVPDEPLHVPPDKPLKVQVELADAQPEPTQTGTRSILELEGLGAEIWKGVNVQAYVNTLRDEWDPPRS